MIVTETTKNATRLQAVAPNFQTKSSSPGENGLASGKRIVTVTDCTEGKRVKVEALTNSGNCRFTVLSDEVMTVEMFNSLLLPMLDKIDSDQLNEDGTPKSLDDEEYAFGGTDAQ
jgi:hypothetical protein